MLPCISPFLAKTDRQPDWFQTTTSHSRDDHYPVCQLDIRQDSECATGYGYPKTAFKWEPDTDPDIRKRFYRCFEDSDFWKSFIYYLQKHLFSLLCLDSQFVYGVISVP